MRCILLPSVAFVAWIAAGTAFADQRASFSALSDIEIVSVTPRSAEVKPFAMSVPSEGRNKNIVLVKPSGEATFAATRKLASAHHRDPSASGDKQ